MKHSNNLSGILFAALLIIVAVPLNNAMAATTSGNLEVKVTSTSSCSFKTLAAVDFGTYNPLDASDDIDGQRSVVFNCAKGIAVYHNNHLIGHTDSSGKLFIPTMYSYTDKCISIDDKDIPMEYSLEKVERYVSPPLRSGTFLPFDAVKTHAFTGRLETQSGGKTIPLRLLKATLTVNGMEVPFVTNGKGEFYLENIKPGRYAGTVHGDIGKYVFTVAIPHSDNTIVNLVGVLAEERR